MTQLGSTVFINLDRDTARRTHMEAECAKAGLSPIGADAKAISPRLPERANTLFTAR